MASTRHPFPYRLPHLYQFPMFPGVRVASQELASLPDFRQANMVFVSNENVLEEMKILVMRKGKTLVTPEQIKLLEDHHVLTKNVHEIRRDEGNQFWRNEKLYVGDKVDLMVVPSVAVDKCGRRVGLSDKKDLLGLVYLLGRRHLEGATIVTLVHDSQVYEEGEIPEDLMGGHDLPVDIVVTPKGVIRVERVRERPKLIDLSLLTYEQIVETPFLWRKVLEEEQERLREVVGREKERTRKMLGEATDRDRMLGEIGRESVGRVEEKPRVINLSLKSYEQIVGTPFLWRKVLEEEQERSRKVVGREKEGSRRMLGEATDRDRMVGEIERESVGKVEEIPKVIDLSLKTYEQITGTPFLWRKVLEEEQERSRKVVDKEKERTRRMLGEATDRDRMVGGIERESVGRVEEKPRVIDLSLKTYEQITGTPFLWRKVLEEEQERSRKVVGKEKERTRRMLGEAADKDRMVGRIKSKSVGRVKEMPKVIDFSLLSYEQIVETPFLWRKVLEEEQERSRKVVGKEKERTRRTLGEAMDRDRMVGGIERKSVGRLKERPKGMSREDNNLPRKNLKRVGKGAGEDEKERGKETEGRDKVDKKRRSKLGESEKKTEKNSVKANISVNLPKNCSRPMLIQAFGECQVVLENRPRQFKIQDDVARICIGEDYVVSVLKKLEGLRIGGQVCRLESSVKVSSEESFNMGEKIAAPETVKKNTSVSQKMEVGKDSAVNLDVADEKGPEHVKKTKVPVSFACMDIREKYRNT